MSQRKSRDREVHFGSGGDTTNGCKSLNEITAVDPSLLRLIRPDGFDDSASSSTSSPAPQQDIPPASHLTFEVDQSSILKSPEEVLVRMTQSQPLVNRQRVIEDYKKEILKLKLQLHKMKHASKKDLENFNLDDEQDLIADLLNKNKQLRKQIKERDIRDREEEVRKKNMLKDSECQTNLDSWGLDELLRASITLKGIRLNTKQVYTQTDQELQQQHKQYGQQSQYSNSMQHHHHQQQVHQQFSHQEPLNIQQHIDHQQPPQAKPIDHEPQRIMSQLHYPSVTLPKQSASSATLTKHIATIKQLAPDEKEILETLFKLDGNMTTVLDKLKAVTNSHMR